MQKQLTCSTELMTNFRQAEAISPQKKFEALHTKDGYSLLFSIGNDNIFYLTQQTPGETTGWVQMDLSSKLASLHGGKSMKAKDFAVSQNHQSDKLDLALVITVDGKDYLYLSLNNEAKLNVITSNSIEWMDMPYDDPDNQNITLSIENLYIAETQQEQYIVADISRKTFKQPSNFLKRYFVDPETMATGRHWNDMVTGGDLDPGIISVLGRKDGDEVDGIYTYGSINGKQELLYAPLFNPFDVYAAPTIVRLDLPKEKVTALATADIGNDVTDLFAIAGKSLYYYPANEQRDGAVGKLLQTNDLFDGIKKLFAFATNQKFVVWGLNRANQVVYTSCLKRNVLTSNMWTYPVPILHKVTQVSPYLNVKDTSNNFFAVSSNSNLKKAVQSPQTSIWDFQQVELKAPINAKAKQFSSYTTRVQLTDGDKQPMQDQTLYVSSNSRTSVHINNLYYVLTPDPIPVQTDAAGSITIMEELEDVSGARITVTDKQGLSQVINPMEKAFQKVASLNSDEKLKDAEIIDPKTGKGTKLVPKDAKQDDLKAVAASNQNIAKAYEKVSRSNVLRAPKPLLLTMNQGNTIQLKGFGDVILAEIGDIFSWLASGVSHIVHLVEDAAKGVWNFVVEIAGKVYQGIMDCVEKVVAAVRWLYDAINTAIQDLLKYLSFLFEWKDITRTKEVLKNIIKLYTKHQVDQIGSTKAHLNTEMDKLKQAINQWAGIKDYNGLGPVAKSTANSQSNPNENQSAPGGLLSSHFQSNGGNAVQQGGPPKLFAGNDAIADKLLEAMQRSSGALNGFLGQFEQLAKDIPSLSLEDILKRVVGIIAGAIIDGATAVMNALLDILMSVAEAALAVLDTPVYIPVVSDILEFFGVPKLSMLDLACWMAAIPLTLGHKVIHGSAPFKDDEETKFLINATKFDDLVKAFQKPKLLLHNKAANGLVPVEITGHPGRVYYVDPASLQAPLKAGGGFISMSPYVEKIVYISGHGAACLFQIISAFVSGMEALEPPNSKSAWGTWSTVFGVITAASSGGANFLIPKKPIKDEKIAWVSTATTGITIVFKLVFSGPLQKRFAASSSFLNNLKVNDGRSTGALVNSILIIPALVCSVFHFIELNKEPSSNDKTAALMDEIGNVTSYASRLSYTVAVATIGPVRLGAVALMTAANVCTAGLHAVSAVAISRDL